MFKKMIWAILIIFISACAANQPGEVVPTATLSPSAEPTALPSSTPKPSITPTLSPTPSPTLPQSTSTPSPVERIAFSMLDPNYSFVYESTISFVNSDGTNLEIPILRDDPLYGSRGYLAWSPDGRYLTFDGGDTATCPDIQETECYEVNYGTFVTDYAQDTILYHIENTFANSSWSPDSQHLVLSIREEWEEGEPTTVADLYILDVNSGHRKPLTSSPSNDLYPSWSPDGQWIAFVRFAPPAPGCGPFSWKSSSNEKCDQASLYMIRPDGSDLQLLFEPIFIYGNTEWSQVVNYAPAWSPDSKWLAFQTRNERGLPDHSNLSIANIKTGEWQIVGLDSWTSISPAWSPDGKKIAFANNSEGRNFDIYLLDLDDDTIIQLTQTRTDDVLPVWSMSGAHIAFVSGLNPSPFLTIMNADGTNKIFIDEEGMGIVFGIPAWLPGAQP